MCDLICDVINCCAFEAAIRVKSTYLTKIMFETQKKGEIIEIKEIFT